MATKTLRLSSLRPFLHTLQSPHSALRPLSNRNQQTRTFLPNPFEVLSSGSASSPHKTFTVTRTLPYSSESIYKVISDVSKYSSFVPYCQSSTVTKWSAPDATYHKRWPSEAILVAGWGGLSENFTSRVYCVPGKIVESVGGETETSLDRGQIGHHLEGDKVGADVSRDNGLLTHLRSKWMIEELEKGESGTERTAVTLSLEFAFANPMYTALSAGAAPKVADYMIKGFEERVKSLMDK